MLTLHLKPPKKTITNKHEIIGRTRKLITPIYQQKIYCDHMTLVFNDGSKEAQKFADGVEPFLGDFASLRSTAIGISDRAIALEVDYITNNKHSHITVAIVPDGKPVESNDIEEWIPTTESLYVTGIYKKAC